MTVCLLQRNNTRNERNLKILTHLATSETNRYRYDMFLKSHTLILLNKFQVIIRISVKDVCGGERICGIFSSRINI